MTESTRRSGPTTAELRRTPWVNCPAAGLRTLMPHTVRTPPGGGSVSGTAWAASHNEAARVQVASLSQASTLGHPHRWAVGRAGAGAQASRGVGPPRRRLPHMRPRPRAPCPDLRGEAVVQVPARPAAELEGSHPATPTTFDRAQRPVADAVLLPATHELVHGLLSLAGRRATWPMSVRARIGLESSDHRGVCCGQRTEVYPGGSAVHDICHQ